MWLLLFSAPVQAATVCSSTCEFPGIQEAIDGSADTLIEVSPGDYLSRVDVTRDVTIRGVGGRPRLLCGTASSDRVHFDDVTAVFEAFEVQTCVGEQAFTIVGGDVTLRDVIATRTSEPLDADGGVLHASGGADVRLEQVDFGPSDAGIGSGGHVRQIGGTLEVVDSTFTDGHGASGGSIYFSGAALTIEGTTFTGARSETHGGTVRHNTSGPLIVRDSDFIDSYARDGRGGCLWTQNGTTTVEDSLFCGCRHDDFGGSGWQGAAIFLQFGTFDITRNVFMDNKNNDRGRAAVVETAGNGSFTNNHVLENYTNPNVSSYGQQINVAASGRSVTITDNLFYCLWNADEYVVSKNISGGSYTGVVMHHNAYYRCDGTPRNWTGFTELGNNLDEVNPLLVQGPPYNSCSKDVAPRPDSPLLGAGSIGQNIGAFPDVTPADVDGDGYDDVAWGGDDCDDSAANVNPGTSEVCNGIDDDCDGTADGPSSVDAGTWWTDGDDDGYGDAGSPQVACSQPTGTVDNSDDCDDGTGLASPLGTEVCDDGLDNDCSGDADGPDAVDALTWYADMDTDGFGDSNDMLVACTAPAQTSSVGGDCDDNEELARPDGTEVCGDGIDNDCSGDADGPDASDATSWFADLDEDTWGDAGSPLGPSCIQPAFSSDTAGDCDDGEAARRPDGTEVCDGLDNDCNTQVDDAPSDGQDYYLDADSDDFGEPTSVLRACALPAGYSDNDLDCDDDATAVNPDAAEVCDGIDNDCDGDLDDPASTDALNGHRDADGDGYGDPAEQLVACVLPATHVVDGTDCDDARADVHPAGTEACNGLDDNCDGKTDEQGAVDAPVHYDDRDADGYGDASAPRPGWCTAPAGTTLDRTDCDDDEPSTYPGAPETPYDGVDSDCDGADPDDLDGDGQPATEAGGGDCDDDDPATYSGAPEVTGDPDLNCDGSVEVYTTGGSAACHSAGGSPGWWAMAALMGLVRRRESFRSREDQHTLRRSGGSPPTETQAAASGTTVDQE